MLTPYNPVLLSSHLYSVTGERITNTTPAKKNKKSVSGCALKRLLIHVKQTPTTLGDLFGRSINLLKNKVLNMRDHFSGAHNQTRQCPVNQHNFLNIKDHPEELSKNIQNLLACGDIFLQSKDVELFKGLVREPINEARKMNGDFLKLNPDSLDIKSKEDFHFIVYCLKIYGNYLFDNHLQAQENTTEYNNRDMIVRFFDRIFDKTVDFNDREYDIQAMVISAGNSPLFSMCKQRFDERHQ